MHNITRILAVSVGTLLFGGAVAAPASAATVHPAGVTICDPGQTWWDVTSKSTALQVKSGDLAVYAAPSSASLTITDNNTFTSSSTASLSVTVGGSMTVSASIKIFDATENIEANATGSIQSSHSYTKTVTQNITIPKGHKMMQYAGHQVTTAHMTETKCSANGTAEDAVEVIKLVGPTIPQFGWMDCSDTTIC